MTMRSSRFAALAAAAVTASVLLVGGCARHSSGSSFVAPQYPDGAAGLKQLWSDIIDAAQHDERERVHDLMATTFMSDAELARLFGPATPPLVPRYHQLMGTLVNRGAVEFVANVFDRRYDAVDVIADENDGALAAALVEPHPLWSVRVHKASETRGLRYDAFLYLDGKWRTANQLSKFVAGAPADPASAPQAAKPETADTKSVDSPAAKPAGATVAKPATSTAAKPADGVPAKSADAAKPRQPPAGKSSGASAVK